ncbi:MAG: PEP-CTERM sorting domain-containing protein [Cyanobacteria bacterium P01_G01_bin.54]
MKNFGMPTLNGTQLRQGLNRSLWLGILTMGLWGANAIAAQATFFTFEWDRDQTDLIDRSAHWFFCDRCYEDAYQPIDLNDHENTIHQTIKTTYDDVSQQLTWRSKFTGTQAINGGWLVISDGPNPKDHTKEYAIFYLDGLNQRLSAYAYNGQNNSLSWQTNEFLQSWSDALTIGQDAQGNTEFSFSINAAAINARQDIDPEWRGVNFANNVGIWFHSSELAAIAYTDSRISSMTWGVGPEGWYDTESLLTTQQPSGPVRQEQVPEPTLMLGMAIAGGWGFLGRKRSRGSFK